MTQFLIILIITSFTLIVINYNLLFGILKKSTALDQYKINHFIWSHCLFIIPVPMIIGLFHFMYLYNITFFFDLKHLREIPYLYNQMFFMESLWFIYFFFLVILLNIIILLILLFVSIYKYYSRNCIKLFIYYYRPPSAENDFRDPKDIFLSGLIIKLIDKLPWYDVTYTNLFCGILYMMSYKLVVLKYGKDYRLLPKVNYAFNILIKFLLHRKTNTLVTISPLIFILYDCMYNDYVITHVFYYLIIWIPVILFSRFCNFIGQHAGYLCESLWGIYYSKRRLVYAISPELKPLLDSYLVTRLKRNIDYGLMVDFDLYYSILFFPFMRDNIFQNNDGSVTIILTTDNEVYEAIFDDDCNVTLGKKWIFLAYKDGK